ncbi:MAG: Calx-beta domain-containing protein, partial [Cyanobacteria bacterium J06643_5]
MELNREIVRLRYEYQGGVGNEITRMLTNNGSGNNNYKLYRSFIVEGGDTTQYREDNNNIRQREIDGETKARGETREIFVYEHKGTGITNSGDGAGEVYIVAHGWNPDFTDFLEIANHVKTAKPAATVLVIDWMQAAQTRNTNPGFNSSAPNFKAVTWIGAIAQEFKAKLQKDFSPQSINFIGHSFGTFVSSETAGLLGGVNTITALDPASRTGTGGYDLYPNKLSRYDLYPDISGRQGPRNFKDVTNYSRAYVGSLSIAGNQALAATAHESFQMNFGLGFRPPGSEHGWVVKTAKTFIDPDHPRKLAENPFSSEEEKPILFSLDDNQFHPQFALDVPGLKGTNLLTQESYVHQGVMVVNQPNEVQFLVAAKTDLTGTLVFGTNQDDDLSPSNEISKDLLLRIGNNTYYADEGDDKIESDAGNDTLYGGEGNDTLDGYIGDDELYGGKGNDSLVGSFGNDGLNGGEGNDTLNGSVGNDDLLGGIGNDSLVGSFGDDALFGDEGNDTLKGSDGDDLLAGGAGDDTLDGGAGRDTAFFSDLFENYDYTFSRNLNPFVRDTITFAHNRGTLADGTDTLKGMDFGQFFGVTLDGETRNYIARLPLEDGPEDNNEISFLNNNGNSIYASLGSSIYMLDGDADYKINLSSSPQNLQYNIAYIIDVSGSMDGTPLQEAKSAYTSLTNSLINSGIADVSQFKVIPFDDGVYPSAVVDANEAISTIQGLSSGGFTYFAPALYTAYNFFDGLPEGGTNIAYFLSDGEASDSFNSKASLLKSLADVQAYGIGDGVDTDQLRIVDSDGNISVLQDPSDLTDEFNNSDFSADSIAKIDLLLDGAVVDTIQSSELIEDALGLSFEGSIDNLDVSFGAENLLTAEIFFTDGTPTSTVDFTIASGLEEVTDDNPFDEIVNGTSGDDTIRLGSIDLGSNSGAGDDKVVGNDLDNIIDSGSGNDIVFGNDGNDTITTGSGQDRIDGGDGMDTVVYTNQFFANSSIQKVGNVITVDNTDTLTNVEFIQFSDVRISTHNLQPIPLLTTSDIVIAEGNSSNTNAQFTFNLSLAPTEDVQFTYSTQDMTAVAGEDYIAKTGQVTIAAGETSATVEVEIVADTVSESEELFVLNLSDVSGAYFENDEPEYNVFATIEQVNILYGDTENNFLEGVSGKNFIDGQEGDDILIGSADDDTLAGGAGNDTLEGSTGNDTYVIDSLNDTIIENASSGNDTVETSINYSLKNVSNVENLTLIGDAIDGIGNSDNNRITGNAKDNTLNGEEGN